MEPMKAMEIKIQRDLFLRRMLVTMLLLMILNVMAMYLLPHFMPARAIQMLQLGMGTLAFLFYVVTVYSFSKKIGNAIWVSFLLSLLCIVAIIPFIVLYIQATRAVRNDKSRA